MPHAWALVESSFPTFTDEETSSEKITQLVDYMKILTEALQYQLENLDADNWNITALENFQLDTTKDVADQLEAVARKLNLLSNEVYNLGNRVSTVEALGGRVTQAETEIAFLERELEETTETAEQLREQMSNAQADIDTLEQEAAGVRDELDRLQSVVQPDQAGNATVGGQGKNVYLTGNIYINGILFEQGGTE